MTLLSMRRHRFMITFIMRNLIVKKLIMKNFMMKNFMIKNLTIMNLTMGKHTIMNQTKKAKRRNCPKVLLKSQILSMILTIRNLMRKKAKRRNPQKVFLKRQKQSVILFIKNLIIMMKLTTMKKSFMTLLSTQWSISPIMNLNMKNLMMNPAIMNLTMKSLIIMNLNMMIITMMRKGCMTLRGTQWHLFTIKDLTRKNITMEMSCMTHLGIQCQNRNISLTSSMRQVPMSRNYLGHNRHTSGTSLKVMI